jgi:hypothetical protein
MAIRSPEVQNVNPRQLVVDDDMHDVLDSDDGDDEREGNESIASIG